MATLNSAPGFQSGTLTVDPGPIVGGARSTATATLTGVALGDLVQLHPPFDLNNSLSFDGFRVSANTLTIALTNLSGTTVDDGATAWAYVWIDRTPVTEVLGQDPR